MTSSRSGTVNDCVPVHGCWQRSDSPDTPQVCLAAEALDSGAGSLVSTSGSSRKAALLLRLSLITSSGQQSRLSACWVLLAASTRPVGGSAPDRLRTHNAGEPDPTRTLRPRAARGKVEAYPSTKRRRSSSKMPLPGGRLSDSGDRSNAPRAGSRCMS